ncbi:MAG: MMPL family transporter, partial [Nocardioidaceae bacterium]|nr:MMPL family transporter [Nocardioidaceae bacterium]
MMQRWGGFVARRARAVLAIGVAVVVAAAVYGVGVFGALGQGGFDDPASESAQELAAEQAAFGGHDTDVVAIYSSDDLSADDPAFVSAVTGVVDELPRAAVERTVPYYAEKAPGLVSTDGQAAMVLLTLEGETQDDKLISFDAVKDKLRAEGLTTNVGGPWAVFDDVNETVSADIARAESISMPIVFLLCLLIFGSVVSALMPGLIGAVAVFGALALVRLITSLTDVSVFAINIITLIGMGLAIDYALFVVSRFREELARQSGTDRHHVDTAVRSTMMTAGRTVLFSGLTVAASLASLLIFPQNFLRSMAYGGVAAVLVAMITALTLLPALLVVLGSRIEYGAMPWRKRRRAGAPAMAGAWARIGHSVMRRPVAYLVVIVAALLALGSPFLSATWGSVDYRVLPADSPSHVAAELQIDAFGGERSTANVVVTGADRATVSAYADRLRAVDDVTSVQVLDEATVDGRPGALLQASWAHNSQAQRSQHIVEQLRDIDPPGAAGALVGGTSAETVDLVASIGAHLPWMGLLVVGVMLVLLFLA